MFLRNKVSADLSTGIHTTANRSIEPSSNLLTNWVRIVESLITSSICPSTKTVLDLYEAETIFGIDRAILLTAMVNHQLPSSFSDTGYQIKYQDLEQFVDRYFYRKNLVSGSYLPKGELY